MFVLDRASARCDGVLVYFFSLASSSKDDIFSLCVESLCVESYLWISDHTGRGQKTPL